MGSIFSLYDIIIMTIMIMINNNNNAAADDDDNDDNDDNNNNKSTQIVDNTFEKGDPPSLSISPSLARALFCILQLSTFYPFHPKKNFAGFYLTMN